MREVQLVALSASLPFPYSLLYSINCPGFGPLAAADAGGRPFGLPLGLRNTPHVLESRLGEIDRLKPATSFSRLILSLTPMPPIRQPSMNSGFQERLEWDYSHEVLFTARSSDQTARTPVAAQLLPELHFTSQKARRPGYSQP